MASATVIRESFAVTETSPGILVIKIFQDMPDKVSSAKQANLLVKEALKIFARWPKKQYRILLEILHPGRGNVSNEARKIYTTIAQHPQLFKTAIVGRSVYLKVIVGFVTRAAHKEAVMQWFTNKAEALQWLET